MGVPGPSPALVGFPVSPAASSSRPPLLSPRHGASLAVPQDPWGEDPQKYCGFGAVLLSFGLVSIWRKSWKRRFGGGTELLVLAGQAGLSHSP